MATISITEDEYEAIRELVLEGSSKMESAEDQVYINSMNAAMKRFSIFEEKYKAAKAKERQKRLIARHKKQR